MEPGPLITAFGARYAGVFEYADDIPFVPSRHDVRNGPSLRLIFRLFSIAMFEGFSEHPKRRLLFDVRTPSSSRVAPRISGWEGSYLLSRAARLAIS
jgi:hypothetical protein